MSYKIEIRDKKDKVVSVIDFNGKCQLSIGHWVDVQLLDHGCHETSYIVSDIYWSPDGDNPDDLVAYVHISPANSFDERRKVLTEKGWL